jgi:hypothetical protein
MSSAGGSGFVIFILASTLLMAAAVWEPAQVWLRPNLSSQTYQDVASRSKLSPPRSAAGVRPYVPRDHRGRLAGV